MDESQRWKRAAALGLGIAKFAIVLGLFAWLLLSGRLDVEIFKRVRLDRMLAAAFVARLTASILVSVRWRGLAVAAGLDVPVLGAIRTGFVGSLFGLAVPGGLATDSAKTYLGIEHNQGRVEDVLSSVVVDRFIGVVTLGFTAILVALVIPAEGLSSIRSALLTAAALLLTTSLLAVAFAGLLIRSPWKRARDFSLGLQSYRGRLGSLLWSGVISFAAQLCVVTGAYLLLSTLDSAITWRQVGLVHPLVILLRNLPTTPAGLGVVDSGAEALYALAGSRAGAELILLTRAVDLAVASLGALWFLQPARRLTVGDSDEAV